MLLRLEILGRYLSLETGKLDDPDPTQQAPDNAPQPMTVCPEWPAEPIGFHAGYWEDDREGRKP